MSRQGPLSGYYALRWQVLERDKFTCQYCGQKAPDAKLEVDHVLPVVDGGDDSPSNLNTSCYACNRGRSGLSIRLRRMKYDASRTAKACIYIPKEAFASDKILAYLKTQEKSVRVCDIARTLGLGVKHACVVLWRLYKRGLVTNPSRGRYSSKG